MINRNSILFLLFILTISVLVSACSINNQKLSNGKKISANTIVFLGNSITSVGKWQTLLPNKTIINKGISGDLTRGVLARIEDCVLAQPEKIFVMIGINDLKIGIPIDTIAANQVKIINKIKQLSPNTKIYMQSTLPVNEGMLAAIYKRLNNVDIAKMNVSLKLACKKQKVNYIDLHPIMIEENGQLKKNLSTDGLHLKPEAYVNWVAYLHTNKSL